MNRLENKTVIITGASGGLGKEIAIQSAKAGANVVLIARNSSKLAQVKAEVQEEASVRVLTYSCDVSASDQMAGIFEDLAKQGLRMDVLVNNAGFGLFEDVVDITLPESKRMLDVNVYGVIASTRLAVPYMIGQGSGHIINIASQAGKIATPKSSVYAATKHAVLGFSNALRLEMEEYGIHVTTVNPGPIATDFFDIADVSGEYVKNVGRFMLRPERVAEKVVSSMLTNRREINLPRWMNAGAVFFAVCPRLFEAAGKKFFFKK